MLVACTATDFSTKQIHPYVYVHNVWFCANSSKKINCWKNTHLEDSNVKMLQEYFSGKILRMMIGQKEYLKILQMSFLPFDKLFWCSGFILVSDVSLNVILFIESNAFLSLPFYLFIFIFLHSLSFSLFLLYLILDFLSVFLFLWCQWCRIWS